MTNCEKKYFSDRSRKSFEIRGLSPRICKKYKFRIIFETEYSFKLNGGFTDLMHYLLKQFTKTVKGHNSF